MIDALTLDQIEVFLAVTAKGSFSGAARETRRSASAVTYIIKKMEEQLGVELFDRASYRASLTEAGRSLLPRARRVSEEMHALRLTARGIAAGVEADLTVAIDSMFPMEELSETFAGFQSAFPTVQLRLFVKTFGPARRMVTDGEAIFGLSSDFSPDDPAFVVSTIRQVDPIMVASPKHPLAHYDGMIESEFMGDHVQLVVTDRVQSRPARDWSVYSGATWRIGDVHTKLALLRAGLGFGSMPRHMVEADVRAGTLVVLNIAKINETTKPFPIALIRKKEVVLGPAARWLINEIESM
jgi:DNA-binding transcriptional LysR family regulator